MIVAQAPGKVVLWGEYAVLAGAPALVMAVDRFARCSLDPGGDRWHIETRGFASTPETCQRSELTGPAPPDQRANWAVLWHVLHDIDGQGLPDGARVVLDTKGFHLDGRKLGLGSSAALTVAVHGALARLTGQTPTLAGALAAHRALQGGAGSGLDVAAAWHGGLIRFQRNDGLAQARAHVLPPGIELRFVWSGRPARTTTHLARFERWLAGSNRAALDRLCAEADGLFSTADPHGALTRYVAALRALDQAAGLGIFSDEHEALARLANAAGVIYKPCGAGGGDLGAAFCADTQSADRFCEAARRQGFPPVSLETAVHGIQITG